MKFICSWDRLWDDRQWYSKKIFVTDLELGTPGAHVQQVKIKPHDIAKNHYHKVQTEIFYFLNENGYFIVNGKRVPAKTGDVIVIEPWDMHEVVNDTDEDFLYMAFKLNYKQEDLYWEADERV
jgi:quercetin dioxygenase-like cupin family protein